jgi:hypothetical protein
MRDGLSLLDTRRLAAIIEASSDLVSRGLTARPGS